VSFFHRGGIRFFAPELLTLVFINIYEYNVF